MHHKFIKSFKSYWMYLFLGFVLLITIGGLITYHYFRQEPVTIIFKDAQGYLTTQIVYKHPHDSVAQVVNRATDEVDKYVSSVDLDQKINTINNLVLVEKVDGTISVDGTVISYTSGEETIQDVLDENNITVSPVDVVTPNVSEILTVSNSNIVIDRITNSIETKTEVLPYISQTVENDDVKFNQVNILQEGQNGIRTYTEEVIYKDGVVVDSYITSEEVTEPVNEIIEMGTNLNIGKPDIEKGDIEAWRPYVIKALEANGLSTEEYMVNKVLRQIETESAGDQNAHQEIVDMNTFIGQEARGLMQTIPSTFEYYHFEGYDDILNGYHNLLAALNYAKERYGSQLNGLGEGHGY